MQRLRTLAKQVVESRVLHYAFAGGAAFTVEYAAFLAIYYILSVPPELANIVSFALGLITSFTLNKLWVFGHQEQDVNGKSQAALYALLALVNLALTTLGIHLLVEHDVPAFIAKLVLIVLVAGWNFIIFRKIIFRSGPFED